MPDIAVTIDTDDPVSVDETTGDIATKQNDGGVVVQLNSGRARKEGDDADDGWFKNLAKDMDAGKLGTICEELIEAIEADNESRLGYLSNVSQGLTLLGLKLEKPKSIASESTGAVEGMSSVTNPLMLDAILRGWANTVGELLPAEGPAKIKDVGEADDTTDDLADALERDFNHYLTDIDKAYYPDTSHMLLWGPYFRGCGIKKVYRCPMRRRPVSESVSPDKLIVDDAKKDFAACGRITHEIDDMRPSVLRRMQLLGIYVDYELAQASPETSRTDQKIASIQGTVAIPKRQEDQPYTLWETQCELDLDDYAPADFKGEGIPLPYRVTIDKDTRKILALHRDWNEDDKDCRRKRLYVKYPYVPGPGFYGTGLMQILGNSTAAMTAAWRISLDGGMYANFAGGLAEKSALKQNTNIIRVSPGEFAPVDTGGKDIRTMFMPMPYRDVTPGLLGLIDRITTQTKTLGGAADIPAAEKIQNVPVGTILSQIEQAMVVIVATHKGMYTAQAEEFGMLIDLFKEKPQDFWRGNEVAPKDFWNDEKFMMALERCPPLVPVADPNVPSHIFRIAKALGLLQLAGNPIVGRYLDPKEVLRRCLRALKEDSKGLVIDPPPQAAAPDPATIAAQAKVESAKAQQMQAQTKAQQAQADMALEPEKIQAQRDIHTAELAREMVIHGKDQAQSQHDQSMDRAEHGLNILKTVHDIGESGRQHGLDVAGQAHDQRMDQAGHQLERTQASHDAAMDRAGHALDVHQALHPPKPASKPKS
jgi:hypothetical protein